MLLPNLKTGMPCPRATSSALGMRYIPVHWFVERRKKGLRNGWSAEGASYLETACSRQATREIYVSSHSIVYNIPKRYCSKTNSMLLSPVAVVVY